MFVGHAGLALAAKRAAPEVSVGALVAASFGIDLLWPVLLIAGVERVRVDPGNTAFTPLAFDAYPWSHSLAMVLLWSLLGGFVTRAITGKSRPAWIVGVLVLSHWVLDALTHRPDLPLAPWESAPRVGLELWSSIPATFLVEGAIFATGIALYTLGTRAVDRVGTLAFAAFVSLTAAVWVVGPFGPPPPGASAIAWVGLAMWLFPVWAAWFDRHRTSIA